MNDQMSGTIAWFSQLTGPTAVCVCSRSPGLRSAAAAGDTWTAASASVGEAYAAAAAASGGSAAWPDTAERDSQ